MFKSQQTFFSAVLKFLNFHLHDPLRRMLQVDLISGKQVAFMWCHYQGARKLSLYGISSCKSFGHNYHTDKTLKVQYLRVDFFIQVLHHHTRNLGFKFQINQSKLFGYVRWLCILQLLTSVIMVTITSHISINIFQMVHLSALRSLRVMRKTWVFFWYQNLRKFEKNLMQ